MRFSFLYKNINNDMKAFELLEASFENIELAKDLADVVMNSGEHKRVKSNTTTTMHISEFDKVHDGMDLNKFLKKYENSPVVDNLEELNITFINIPNYDSSEQGVSPNAGGWYLKGVDEITVVLTRLGYAGYDRDREIRRILIHEFRHFLQNIDFTKYFNSRAAERAPYEKRPYELDASWTDMVGDNPPPSSDSQQLIKWANAIITLMERVKTLDDRTKKHYRKKTLAYAVNYFYNKIDARWKNMIKDFSKSGVDPTVNAKTYINKMINKIHGYARTLNFHQELPRHMLLRYKADVIKAYRAAKIK